MAGLVGSCLLPVLGAVPDGAIVLFSGMGPDAQAQLSVGVGALAGSTIMLLTVPWFLSVYAGRVDIENGHAKYRWDINMSLVFNELGFGLYSHLLIVVSSFFGIVVRKSAAVRAN